MFGRKIKLESFLWFAVTAMVIAPALSVFGQDANAVSEKMQPCWFDELRQAAPELDGSGVGIAVISRSQTYIDGKPQNDYMPYMEHNSLVGKSLNFYDQNSPPRDVSLHSTAICSILFGQDSNAFNRKYGNFRFSGATPQARGEIYEFWHFLTGNVFPQVPPDANIITASMGSQFEDWWTRGLEAMAERYGIVITTGIGNGRDVFDPPLYPGASANVIGVGVVDSVNRDDLAAVMAEHALAYPEHSTCGPTIEGRCKPDIVAVGNCLAADISDVNSYEPTGSWSSYSTPLVTGTIGLLTQKAMQETRLKDAVSGKGSNCVMRAIIMNSARKLPYWHKGRLSKDDDNSVPLDFAQGAGLLDPAGAYRQLVAGPNKPGNAEMTGWDLNTLTQDSDAKNAYSFSVSEPNDKLIAVTAVWNRHYDWAYPFAARRDMDQDLRLELWGIDSADQNNRTLLDYSDSKADNVEHIYYPADVNYSKYEIVVTYGTVPGPNHVAVNDPYGLAWDVVKKQTQYDILWYDLNADGMVNPTDFILLLENTIAGLKKPDQYIIGDINGDGRLDPNDFRCFLDRTGIKIKRHKKQN